MQVAGIHKLIKITLRRSKKYTHPARAQINTVTSPADLITGHNVIMEIKRNPVIDYMRCLGMALIIFAHISPPLVLFQLRTFDVPMMAFISGMAFYCAEKQKVKFTSYALSRVKRLVYPVWAFQLFFFLALFIVKPASLYPLVSLQTIISSAALSGFGF